MSENKLKARFQHATKTEAEWKTANPVLLKGEIAYSSDKKKWKTGNGTAKWSELTYDKAEVTKSDVGLGNVDNTADANKSVKYATTSGSATTSTKLSTARTISLSNGASGSVSFDGSANVNIPVNEVKESYLTWGGKNFSSGYGCVDAAMIPDLGANRFAFGKPEGIKVEYSRDSGSSWTDYGASDACKIGLFGTGESFFIGKADSSNKATGTYLLRVTVDTDKFRVYTVLNKFAIYISTGGSNGCYCTIDASLESTPTTWVNFANKVPIGGWSGWNIINIPSLTTYYNSESVQYGLIRFTFGCVNNTSKYNGLQIFRIMGFGGVGWTAPSNMAKYGTIYSYDNAQNVSFPANVSASLFNGALNGCIKDSNDGRYLSITYSKAGQTSTSWLASWNGNELGSISPNNIIAGKATALTTSSGSVTQPVYFSNGKPVPTTYSLNKSVPSNAVFTDMNMTQTANDPTNYTNWRPLLVGASSSDKEGFTPTSVTDKSLTFSTISVQPSSGTIRATTFKGNATSATKVNGHTVNADVPSGAKFTDTIYTHPTSSGNKHIPNGGSAGQILRWSADGTAVWGADNNTTYSTGTASASGLTKLYAGTGTNTDGTMTQAAIKSVLDGKAANNHNHDSTYLKLSGGTVTGDIRINGNIFGSNFNGVYKDSDIIIIPNVPYSKIDPTCTNNVYFKELIKWICENYPKKKGCIFVGSATPNSENQVSIRIYDTNVVDKNGYPEYASGYYTSLGGRFYTFGFYKYEFYYKEYSDVKHTHKKSQISDFPSSMPASDVYSWAKKSTKPSYTASEVGLGNVGNFKAVSTVASQGLSSTEKANARANIGAGTSSFSGSYTDLTNKPTIPSVGNGTITITQNGTSKGTFSMNQSGNTTISLTDTNTNTWRPQPDWNATSGDAVILNKPTIPTNTNQLTNGAGFTTNIGTITGIKMNGSSKGTSGIVDLGNVVTYTTAGDIRSSGHVYLNNGKSVRSYTTSGGERQVIGLNDGNHVVIGYGTYAAKDTSTTSICAGNKIQFQLGKQGKIWRPYIEAGDSITLTPIQCGGYITGVGKEVYFTVPLDRPIIAGTTITVASVSGITVRQAGKYLFGSSADAFAKPSSYSATSFVGGINVRCVMSNTTNSTNNDACGVCASIKITFS